MAQSSAEDRADRADVWMLLRVEGESSVVEDEDEEEEVGSPKEESSEFPGMDEEADTASGRRDRLCDAFVRVLVCCRLVIQVEEAPRGDLEDDAEVGWKASAPLLPPRVRATAAVISTADRTIFTSCYSLFSLCVSLLVGLGAYCSLVSMYVAIASEMHVL